MQFVRISQIVRTASASTVRFEPIVGVSTSERSPRKIVVPRETDSHHRDLPLRYRPAGQMLVSRETESRTSSSQEM